jgi:hypothetical protein
LPTGVVLAANAAAGAILVAAGLSSRVVGRPHLAVSLAALPLVIATLLSVYVFGEDTYRDHGISRWHAYRSPGGALGEMFVLCLALMGAYAGVLACAGLRSNARLCGIVAVMCGLTSLGLVTATIVGFSAN